MLTLLAAAGSAFALGAGFDWALRPAPAAISASIRPAIVVVNLLFKVPPFLLCRAVLAGRERPYKSLESGIGSTEKFIPQLGPAYFSNALLGEGLTAGLKRVPRNCVHNISVGAVFQPFLLCFSAGKIGALTLSCRVRLRSWESVRRRVPRVYCLPLISRILLYILGFTNQFENNLVATNADRLCEF